MTKIKLVFFLFLVTEDLCSQDFTGDKGSYKSFSLLQGIGWYSSDASAVEKENPLSTTGLLFDYCKSKGQFRLGLSLCYLRIPYRLSYYSAGRIDEDYFIWRTSEVVNTHSLQIGFSYHIESALKRGRRRCFKLYTLAGFNFIEREVETRNYEFQRDNTSNAWVVSTRETDVLMSNQSSDVRQWRISVLCSYGMERVLTRKWVLSYAAFLMSAQQGNPRGPFLSFDNINSFPRNAAGEPRLQEMLGGTYIVGFTLGIGIHSLENDTYYE